MAFVSITPASNSIIATGDSIVVSWDSPIFPQISYRPSSGPAELISYPSSGGGPMTVGAGYTASYDTIGPDYTTTFSRDAGWSSSPFVIGIYDRESFTELQISYTLLAEGQYPNDMQPFNDPVEGGDAGTVQIRDGGVAQGSAGVIDFADNLTATVADSVATVTGQAGGGGPGLDGIYGSLETDGVGGYTLSANSQGVASATLQLAEVRLNFSTPFGDDDFPVQATVTGETTSGNIVTVGKDVSGSWVVLRVFDEDNNYLNPTSTALSFDFFIGGATIEGGAGGSDITVVDETTTLTTGVTKFTYTGDGVTVTEDATADELTVTIPGVAVGAADGGIFGTITADGAGGISLSGNSQGIEDPPILQVAEIRLNFEVPFPDADYPVQVTPNGTAARFGSTYGKTTGYVVIRFFDEAGNYIYPQTNAISFDILAGGLGIGDGDVSSSETSVQVQRFAIWDGTSGKLIKSSDVNTYQSGTGIVVGGSGVFGRHVSCSNVVAHGSAPYIEVVEYVDGPGPPGGNSFGRFWVKPPSTIPVTSQTRPYFVGSDGTQYDLSEGGGTSAHLIGGDSHTADTLANFNTKISDATTRVSGTHITATDPVATAVDGDIWIEIT